MHISDGLLITPPLIWSGPFYFGFIFSIFKKNLRLNLISPTASSFLSSALDYGMQQFQNQYLLVQFGLCSYGIQSFQIFFSSTWRIPRYNVKSSFEHKPHIFSHIAFHRPHLDLGFEIKTSKKTLTTWLLQHPNWCLCSRN